MGLVCFNFESMAESNYLRQVDDASWRADVIKVATSFMFAALRPEDLHSSCSSEYASHICVRLGKTFERTERQRQCGIFHELCSEHG